MQTPVLKVHVVWRYGFIISLMEIGQVLGKSTQAFVEYLKDDNELLITIRFPNESVSIPDIPLNLSSEIKLNEFNYLNKPGILLRELVNYIATFIEGYHINEDTNCWIVCSHCKDSEKPFLFKDYEIIKALTEKNNFVFCEHIHSPSRCVNIQELAPDITLEDIQEIL